MSTDARQLYINLLKNSILGLTIEDKPMVSFENNQFNFAPKKFDRALRELGQDWPSMGQSMIGLKRMENIKHCLESVISSQIPGDLIETGVWRGGATIFMRGILKAYDVSDKTVWVADSFAGLPPPNPEKYPHDKGLDASKISVLAVSLEQVQENFRRYGLLDDQVRFLKGWFKDTLAGAPIEKLSILRLDGDLYESTMDAIRPLYPRLAPGGYIIVDDYQIPACRQAIQDYRNEFNITDEIVPIDNWAVYWQKSS